MASAAGFAAGVAAPFVTPFVPLAGAGSSAAGPDVFREPRKQCSCAEANPG